MVSLTVAKAKTPARGQRYIWTSKRSGSLTRLANDASRFGMTKGWYGFSAGRGCACGGGLAEGADAVEEGADAGGVYGIFHDAVFFQAGADDDAVGEFEERGDVFDRCRKQTWELSRQFFRRGRCG